MSIEVRNISKAFGSFRALDNVSLTVPDGKLVALLGPSGSGKTTLLRIIAGLEQADSVPGKAVLFAGQDVSDRGVGERRVGFVFQHYALFRTMTVFENVAFGLRSLPRRARPPKREIAAKVNELLALVQLTGLENRRPWQLSGGQRQRVALARALAIKPSVLLLDEPFGALDANVRQDLRNWLRRLHNEIKVTSLFVTHDQEEALELADVVVIMRQGRVEQIGTPDEVFHKPASEFVLRFLGKVNLFHGRNGTGADPAAPRSNGLRLLARPHEVEISLTATAESSVQARVARILSAGPSVKILLLEADGTEHHADISHKHREELGLTEGQTAYVTPVSFHTFLDHGAAI
ncbi:TOBE-like domain-containing protein [Solidesulfovibrio sp.]|uniref:sulfate/molybdate ABC transporter ATP-binding protein n=1 Tax=Solidesulfovibrio sp. TaxID=2910990 RepID=UPI00262BD0BD|nr:TOBE-like domain-containing protein [Solidesulfovibrio sp.]